MGLEPVIFLLDLDGTLQGDIRPQIEEYELIRKMNVLTDMKVKYDLNNLYKDMGNGLIRPNVQKALITIKKKHPNIELYIYTASSDEWALFLLPKIIKYLFKNENIINKPFFTRSHCIENGYKSIEKVKPLIINNLKNKYTNTNFKHIYLVDNNIVLKTKEINKLIYCPSYDFKALNCPLRNFKDKDLNEYHKSISSEIFNGYQTSHKLEMLKIYYDRAFKEYIKTDKDNEKYVNDNYWLLFQQILMKNKLNKEESIMKTVHKLRMLYFPKSFLNVIEAFVDGTRKLVKV